MLSRESSASASRLPLALLIFFMVAASLSGGSNRGDVITVVVVRLAAVLCLGAAIIYLPRKQIRDVRTLAFLLGALWIWILIQLIPLPPFIWTALPGRTRLASTADTIGMTQPWMSISIIPTRTLNSLLSLLVPTAVLALVAWLPRSTWIIQSRIILVIGLLSAILALIQISSSVDAVWYIYNVHQKGGAVGFFANRNHQAVLLATMLPILALQTIWAVRTRSPVLVYLSASLAISGFFLVLIFVTGSRAGLIVSGISMCATLVMIIQVMKKAKISRRLVALSAGFIIIIGAILVGILFSSRSLSLARLTKTDIGDEQRVLVMEPIARLIRENMPFGTGFGTFDPAFQAIEPYSQLYRTYLNHAHSDPLEFISDGGAPAAIILFLFAFWWTKTTFVLWSSAKFGNAARAANIVTGLFMIASAVDYPLRTPLAAAIFALMLGWMSIAAKDDRTFDGDAEDSGYSHRGRR